MKKLITVEEHFTSHSVRKKVADIINAEGTEAQKQRLKFAGGLHDDLSDVEDLGSGRIAYMDAHGVDTQIISYSSGNPSTMDPKYAIPLCQEANDEIYAATKAYPGRFYGFAYLPYSSPEAAAKELERAVKELGFVGAFINGQYGDHLLDDEWFHPIYKKAAELDVPVYLHPALPNKQVIDTYYKRDWPITTDFAGYGIGWHYDVGVQLLRMILAGVFDQYPTLKVIIGHWGEVVAYYVHRMDEIGKEKTGLKRNVSEYFKTNIYTHPSGMHYDEQFRLCLDIFGVDHILWGDDYPYRKIEDVREYLEKFDLPADQIEKIAHENAEKLFRI